jgi:hypothetical protein
MTDVIVLDGKADRGARVRLYALIPKKSTVELPAKAA